MQIAQRVILLSFGIFSVLGSATSGAKAQDDRADRAENVAAFDRRVEKLVQLNTQVQAIQKGDLIQPEQKAKSIFTLVLESEKSNETAFLTWDRGGAIPVNSDSLGVPVVRKLLSFTPSELNQLFRDLPGSTQELLLEIALHEKRGFRNIMMTAESEPDLQTKGVPFFIDLTDNAHDKIYKGIFDLAHFHDHKAFGGSHHDTSVIQGLEALAQKLEKAGENSNDFLVILTPGLVFPDKLFDYTPKVGIFLEAENTVTFLRERKRSEAPVAFGVQDLKFETRKLWLVRKSSISKVAYQPESLELKLVEIDVYPKEASKK